jgi:transposase-like protein
MQVVTELKNRGVTDIFIACVDGLKGFPEAIEAVYPQTQVRLCMVHMVRHSLSYVSHKDRKQVAADLKMIYQAATLEEAERQLTSDLYDEHDRVAEHDAAEDDKESLLVPERRGGLQADVLGAEEYQ